MPTRKFPPDNSTIHVYLRGTRKMPIVEDENDCWMFLDAIYRANRREDARSQPGVLYTPNAHPHKDPLVYINTYCLVKNHYHLELEVKKGSEASKFIQRLNTSLTRRWQKKTGSAGRLFESNYRWKVLKDEPQARVLFLYITVINSAEAMGINRDTATIDELIVAATNYKFSAFPDYFLGRKFPIVHKSRFKDIFPDIDSLRKFLDSRTRSKV